MSDRDEFLATVLPRHRKAIDAAHNGDPTLFVEEWSTREPVTLFGAVASGLGGGAAVTQAMGSVAARFSNGTPVDFEVVAAEVSGELAYLVGYERSSFSVDGGPVEANMLRVTHIYRREEGAWKLVHRHGDPGSGGNPAVGRFQANPGRPRRRRTRPSGPPPWMVRPPAPARRGRRPGRGSSRTRAGQAECRQVGSVIEL